MTSGVEYLESGWRNAYPVCMAQPFSLLTTEMVQRAFREHLDLHRLYREVPITMPADQKAKAEHDRQTIRLQPADSGSDLRKVVRGGEPQEDLP